MKYCVFESKIGPLTIVSEKEEIVKIGFGNLHLEYQYDNNDKVINDCYEQINNYLAGKTCDFTFPYNLKCTDFQRRVLKETLKIPYGKTKSYQDIAIAIGNPKSSRAVGMALGKNPLPIVIPCHRVIGKNKKLVGFTGGLDKKVILLEIEENNVK